MNLCLSLDSYLSGSRSPSSNTLGPRISTRDVCPLVGIDRLVSESKALTIERTAALARFLHHTFPNDDYLKDPRACALLNTSLEGVPPCLLIVANLDPLRDGSFGMDELGSRLYALTASLVEYQKMLEKAGVKTKLVLIEGVVHGFFALPGE